MGKPSKSSSKRKRSKPSSKGYVKKSTKNKRSKSKKSRRHGGGSVSYSDDDSLSSTSASSFSSEDSGRRGRSRLRSRKSGKSTKKRRLSCSSSSEDSTRGRKRKRAVGTDDHKGKSSKLHVKKSSRKKAKRERSDSSKSSSDCSTCQSSHSEYERRGRKHGPREKDKTKSEITKDEGRKSRYGSRSSSFSKHDQSGDNCSAEPVSSYYASNRLRSVIIVVSEGKEDEDVERDIQKEEMVYNDDDYPSCRSNDSNDGGNRKDRTDLSNAESKITRTVEDCQREEKSAELAGSLNNLDGQSLTSELLSGTNEAVKEIDDLESILRQKALENLRKFRRVAQTNSKSCVAAKNSGDTDCRMAESSQTNCLKDGGKECRMAESSQTNCVKDVGDECRMAESSPIRSVKDGDTECRMAESSQVKREKDDYTSILNEVSFEQSQDQENIPYQNNGTQESKSAEDNVLPTNKVENVKKSISSCNIQSRLVTSALKAAFSRSNSIQSVRSASEQAHLSKTLDANNPVVGDAAEQSAVPIDPPGGDSSSASASTGCVQGAKAAAEDPKSSNSQNEPQLEEKTMSVMRGGELVQVSYKVYIPKKAPALARRQFKR